MNLDQPHPRDFSGYQPLPYKKTIVSSIFLKIFVTVHPHLPSPIKGEEYKGTMSISRP